MVVRPSVQLAVLVAVLVSGCVEYGIGPGLDPVTKTETTEPDPTGTDTTTTTTSTTTTTTSTQTDPGTTVIADAPVYAHTATDLYTIDPLSGDRDWIGAFHLGPTPITQMVDIAIDLTGRMYGGTYDALYQIDPQTASISHVCDIDVRPYALAFTSDGVLFAGAGPDVVAVDPVSCRVTPLATSGNYETSGDLVGLPDGFLYWTVRGSPNDELIRVDPVTGATFWIGVVGEEKLFGLGYHDGQLYGFSDLGAIVRIEPLTAQTTVLSSDGTRWWGATTNPVLW